MVHNYFYWNPSRVAFYIPKLGHPVVWYGVTFALGVFLAYLLTIHLVKREVDILAQSGELKKDYLYSFKSHLSLASSYVDSMAFISIIGLVVGARIGYILFYGLPLFKQNPLELFRIWGGGLASHGACVGILAALVLFLKRQKKDQLNFSFFQVLDLWTIPAGIIAFFIRLGNFINQEILGTVTNKPWAIIFGDPLDGSLVAPRHPVQLYEALFYLLLSTSCYLLYISNRVQIGSKRLSGYFITTLFIFRLFIEFFKESQGYVLGAHHLLQMGQLLSIPFIIGGATLLALSLRKKA